MDSDTLPQSKPLRRPHLLALVGYGLLTALFYAPVLLGIHTLAAGDFTDHFLPFSIFQRGELLAHRLPVWNPYTYAGHPFLADVQAAVFYPVGNLVLLLTLPFGSAAARLYALQLEVLIEFVLAGFFTFLLAYSLLRKWLPASLAGGVMIVSGYLTGYPALQLAILRTAIWLPLVLWLLLRAFEQPRRWRWWISASLANATAFLGGHPQTFLYLSYAVLAWIALLLLRSRRRSTQPLPARSYLGRIALFYTVFLGLIAAQLLPSIEFTRLSVRASVDFAFVSGGLPPADTWQMILPHVTSVYAPLYVGVVALGLALLAVFQAMATRGSNREGLSPAAPSEWRPFVAFFAAVALIALLVSYGSHGFLFVFFYRWLPGWNLFQGQERVAYLVAFSLSVLAGFGLAGLDSLADRTRRLAAMVYAGVVSIGMAMFLLHSRSVGLADAPPASVWHAVAVSAIVLVAMVLVLWPAGWSRWRLALITALALAELFVANAGTNTDRVGLTQQAALPPQALAVQAAVAEASAAEPPVVQGRAYNEHQVYEDYGMRTRVEDLWGSSPLRLARYALLENLPIDRLWQLMGVQHVLSAGAELYSPAQPLAVLPGPDGSSYLHRLQQPGPRAWVVPAVQSMEDSGALPWLADARFDPQDSAILPPVTDRAGRDGFLADGLLALPGQNRVRLERLAPNRLRADVESQHGGLLVMSENWMPGWRAAVKEAGNPRKQPAPVVRADVTLLGVPVGPGHTTVEMMYWPTSVSAGLWISGATLLLLGLGSALGLVARRHRTKDGVKGTNVRGRAEPAAISDAKLRFTAVSAAIVLVAFGLRVWGLGFLELRGDEAFGYFFSLNPVSKFIHLTIEMREPHPVASYFVQHGWLRLSGHSEFALRFLGIWFGVLAVALLYRLGRRIGIGIGASALAAGLLAVSSYAIGNSRDARMYGMCLALTTASTWLALEATRRTRWLPWSVGYVLVSWLALQTHYFAVFILLAQNLFVIILALLDRSSRPRILRWLAMQVAIALLYLPWLLVAWNILTGYPGTGDSPGLPAALLRSLSVFAAGETLPADQRGWLVLPAVALLIGAVRLALAGPQARRALLLLLLYLWLPLLATWLSAQQRPIFSERYLIAAAPPFFLLLAASLLGWESEPMSPLARNNGRHGALRARRLDRMLTWAAAAVLGLSLFRALGSLAGYYTDTIYSNGNGWRESAAALERYTAGAPAGQAEVVANYPDQALWYYYLTPAEHLVLPPAANDLAATTEEVVELVEQGVQRIVIPLQPIDWWDNAGMAERALARQYTLLTTAQVADWPVEVYVRPPSSLQPVVEAFITATPSAEQTEGLRLAAFAVPAQALVPGDVLDVYLSWKGSATALAGGEKISLQLLDSSGHLAAQTDQPLGAANLEKPATTYALPVPWQLPPGDYRLIAAVYDSARPGAPRLLTASGADHVSLTTLRR